MQTWSGSNTRGTNSSTRRLTLYALLFFSLAGLISGFAFGGFLHSNGNNTAKSTGPVITTTKTPQTTPNVTPTPTAEAIVPLGLPKIDQSTFAESAKGGTVYSLGMQVIDKQNKTAVHASDITCKAWLVQQIPTGQTLKIDDGTFKNVGNLGDPITGMLNNMPVPEVIGGLTFDATTPQTGFCNSKGHMTWKYTIAQTVTPGPYSIVVAADWKGMHWNWSWVNITIS